MEGQRILASLKGKESWEEIYEDSKNYLAPVVSKNSKSETAHFGKYELFSLKLFKLVIELLAKCEAQQKHDILRNIGVLCIESLQVCVGYSGKAPPLSFEKMLLHFTKCCFTLDELEFAEMSCRVLHSQLAGYKGRSTAEVQALFKHVFDMLWKSSLLTERKLGVSACEKCLELQELAFKCLLSSGDFELAFVVERIIKTDVHYYKLCTNESTNQSTCTTDRCTNRDYAYNRLYSFHTSLLKHKDIITLVRADLHCTTFSTSLMYILHLVHLYTKTSHRKEAQSHLKLALKLCNNHSACCHEETHIFVSAQAHCLRLWITLTETNGNSHLVNSLCLALAASLEDVSSTEVSAGDTPFMQRLIEYLEIIVTHLKERREAFVSQTDENDEDLSVAFVHQKTFEPLRSVLLNSVECLEMFLKAQLPSSSVPNLEQSARSRQLYLLSFLTDVLVDLLSCDDDEIEIMRSSSTVVTPPHAQTGHPKQELAESCLPLLKNSQQIITKASTGVLPSSEHKWLGNDAYRLYQALYHCKLYGEASEVLRVSCEELTYWCRESDSEEQQLQRALESHLLERFVCLCEAHRMDSNYSNAMKAIENALVSLPMSQIATEECVSSLVAQWVKIKRDVIKEGMFPCEDKTRQQSILQALRQVKSLTDDTKILYLEAELKLYKSHGQLMHSCEQLVIRNLLDLYSHGDQFSELNRARLTIELASISRQCASPDDMSGSPITLLDEAVALLEPLTTHTHSPSTTVSQSYQHLATAYLWKAICTWEEHMNSCGQSSSPLPEMNEPSTSKSASDEREKETELCLSQDEEQVLMSDDVLQCLYSAVEGWEGLWRAVTESNTSSTLSTSCFHNCTSLFHHLYLTSSLCLAHSQPAFALKSLRVMLDIYGWFTVPPSELQTPYQKALALYHQLLISFADQELDTQPLEFTVSSSKPESIEVIKKEQSELRESLLHCKLVLAEWYLTRGKKYSCHALLVDVLSDPFHEKSSTMSFFVVAKAKLLVSEYLQQCDFEIMPSSDFLHYLCIESDTTPVDCEDSFRLSPLEVVMDSVKIFRQLAEHRHVRSTREDDDQGDNEVEVESTEKRASSILACSSDSDHLDEAFVIDDQSSSSSSLTAEKHSPSEEKGGPSATTDQKQPASVSHIISPVVSAWEILVSLLSALKKVARLHLLQGNVKQAYYYAKEGAMLARTMLLQGWYIEFCILLCEIHLTRGHMDGFLVFINQIAKLLECEDYCKSVITSIEIQVKSTSPTCGDNVERKASTETVITADESSSAQSDDSDDSDDSFLSELVASVQTPPLSRAGAAQTSNHTLNTHPSFCTCLMCVCHMSLLQNVKLALLVCELATQMALESQGDHVVPNINSCAETILKVLSEASELLNNRIPKCNSVFKSIVIQGGGNVCNTTVHSRPKSKSQRAKKSGKSNEKSSRTGNEPSLDVTRSSSYFCVSAELTKLTADIYLLLLQPDEAIICIERTLGVEKAARTETFSNEKLAQLHYTLGIARVQELEISHPELAKSLWEGGSSSKEKSNVQVAVDQENDPRRANLQHGKDVPEEEILVTRRPRRSRKAISKSKPGSTTQIQPSSKSKLPVQLSQAAMKVVEHFFIAYQMCYPSMPALLLRDITRWLALLLSGDSSDIASHFLALSMNITHTHQTVYSLGKKIKNYQHIDTKSPLHHAQEALSSLTHSSSHVKSQSSSYDSTFRARHLLQSAGTPPSLSYTKKLLTSLTPQWSMCTICLAPKTHPTRPTFLLLSRTVCGGRVKLVSDDFDEDETPTVQVRKSSRTKTSRKISKDICIDLCTLKKTQEKDTHPSSVLVKIPTNGFSFLHQCDDIHHSAAESVSLKEKTEWWVARRSLDTKMKELLLQLESECLGDSAALFTSPQSEGDSRTVILVLGQHVHRLPWECLSTLKGLTVTRMPSLAFASAHKTLVGYNGSLTVNPNSAYYVLNPHGDLLKTEKLFSSWFANNLGWEGVVGKSPSHEQFAAALQDRDLYVYCGHSAGKFLDTSGFHLLHCQATALLLGCSSGKLVASGKCDPSGIALNYLMAGCPSLVGCLWDVTDGEIDRFCKALLESILEHNKKGKPTQRSHHQSSKSLPAHVNSSRTACKLHWLVGAAPVVYGLPVTTKLRPH